MQPGFSSVSLVVQAADFRPGVLILKGAFLSRGGVLIDSVLLGRGTFLHLRWLPFLGPLMDLVFSTVHPCGVRLGSVLTASPVDIFLGRILRGVAKPSKMVVNL
jgi:hypothetical protein